MINYMQSNIYNKNNVISNIILKNMFKYNTNGDYETFFKYINTIENNFAITKKLLIKKYIYFLLTTNTDLLNREIILEFECLIHNCDDQNIYLKYIYYLLNNL